MCIEYLQRSRRWGARRERTRTRRKNKDDGRGEKEEEEEEEEVEKGEEVENVRKKERKSHHLLASPASLVAQYILIFSLTMIHTIFLNSLCTMVLKEKNMIGWNHI